MISDSLYKDSHVYKHNLQSLTEIIPRHIYKDCQSIRKAHNTVAEVLQSVKSPCADLIPDKCSYQTNTFEEFFVYVCGILCKGTHFLSR